VHFIDSIPFSLMSSLCNLHRRLPSSLHRPLFFGWWKLKKYWVVAIIMSLVLFSWSSSSMISMQSHNRQSLRTSSESRTGSCQVYNGVAAQVPVEIPIQLSDYMRGSGLDLPASEQRAVCDYADDNISLHFAHAMQQVYSCLSFWQTHPEKQPVLNVKKTPYSSIIEALRYKIYTRRNANNAFMKGMYQVLQDLFGVVIVHNQQYPYSVQVIRNSPWSDGYAFLPGSTRDLRDKVLQSQGLPLQNCPSHPRIAIFDRSHTRSLEHVHTIHHAVEKEWPDSSPVPIVYLEGKNFTEQINAFAQSDIIITPHGAQLTSIPFMRDCGGVLEIFPDGYLVPQYYGTLAHMSLHSHAYLYPNLPDDPQLVNAILLGDMQNTHYRRSKRSENVCPSSDSIIQSVHTLVEKWQQCCLHTARNEG
jgi:hypothetical protein